MHKKTRVITLALSIVMIFGIMAGCQAVNNNPVIGKVGDITITYSMYSQALESVQQYYDYGAITVENADNPQTELREKAFDQVVDGLLPIAAAHRDGLTLTEEEEAAAAKTADDNFQKNLDDSTAELGENVKEDAKLNYFTKLLKQNGYSLDEFKQALLDDAKEQALSTKIKAQVEVSAVASEGIMKHWYEEEIKYEKQAYEKDLGAYYNALQYYDYITGVPPLYTPKGFMLIKQILIANPAEGETKDIDEIAAEVKQKLDEGADFDELMTEYNEDPGAQSNPAGYFYNTAIAGEYLPEFSEAAEEMKEGDVKGPIKSSEGIHFLKCMGEAPEAILPYEMIEEPLREYTLQTAKDELYSQALEKWREEITIVKDEKRIESLDMAQASNKANRSY